MYYIYIYTSTYIICIICIIYSKIGPPVRQWTAGPGNGTAGPCPIIEIIQLYIHIYIIYIYIDVCKRNQVPLPGPAVLFFIYYINYIHIYKKISHKHVYIYLGLIARPGGPIARPTGPIACHGGHSRNCVQCILGE